MEDKYIYEKNVSDDINLKASLIKCINKWANAIPHHPYKNLGDKINIKSIWYKPAYPIRLRSQYEERSRKKDHEPYTNQNIPTRKYYKISDFNAWDISLSSIKDFTDNTKNYYVNGSQYIADCHTCDAKGWITCVQCHGAKTITCPTCSGSGKVNCHNCGGHGTVQCSSCGGRGYNNKQVARTRQVRIPEEYSYDSDGNRYTTRASSFRTETYYENVSERCTSCGGTGRKTCTVCSGTGKLICKRCSGRGKITCPTCGGTGRNVCPTCQGKTKLMHYFYVERKLDYTDQQTCVINSEVYDGFPQYLDEYPKYESRKIFSSRKEDLIENPLPDNCHLNSFVNKFLKEAASKNTDTHSKQFQQLDVKCIDTWELSYSFKGKDYVMCFTGSNFEIIPGLSPIYEVAYNNWEKGVALAKRYMYSSAVSKLKKSLNINVYEIKDQVQEALESVKSKIDQSYSMGSLIAALLMLFFGSFISYSYFTDINYVFPYAKFINNPDNFLFAYHAWSITLLYFVCGYYLYKKSAVWARAIGYKMPSSLLRIVTGFAITTVSMSILLLVLGLLNATGITIVLTFFVWLIVKVVKIVLFLLGIFIGLIILLAKAIWGILTWIVGLF